MTRINAGELGLKLESVGIRGEILPGDTKNLVKKVTAAKLISRRDETAPCANRLRELEVLEKIALTGNLNVVLGEKGLAERVVNLLATSAVLSVYRAFTAGTFFSTLTKIFAVN